MVPGLQIPNKVQTMHDLFKQLSFPSAGFAIYWKHEDKSWPGEHKECNKKYWVWRLLGSVDLIQNEAQDSTNTLGTDMHI